LINHFPGKVNKSKSTVTVVIPAHNEKDHIKSVVSRCAAFIPVLVVDDGSNDETMGFAEEAGAVVIRQFPNRGKGAALREGFRWAIAQGYQGVITLDADGQHAPEEIPDFLRVYETEHPDLIIGTRNFRSMPLTRRLANSFGAMVFSWAVRQRIHDNQSGYRLLSRRLMQATLNSNEHGFEFEVEMVVTCLKNKWKLSWVPIQTIYADEKSHIRPVKHTLNFLRVVRKAHKNMKDS
jgi:glycosyltransferase involved in cell wall biosynthesis